MTGDLGIYIVFALGVLVGLILGNKDFRYKFFKGLRKFLGNVGRGADNLNRTYTRQEGKKREYTPLLNKQSEVRHIYKQIHTQETCPTCVGSGKVYEKTIPLKEGAIGYKPEAITCPQCGGEGRIWN